MVMQAKRRYLYLTFEPRTGGNPRLWRLLPNTAIEARRAHPDLLLNELKRGGEQNMNAQSFGPIGQVAYLVENIEESVANWARFSGIGPWTVYKNVTLDGWWKGQDVKIKMNVGLSYQDEVQMELIQVVTDGPAHYREDDGTRIVRMHHMAWITQNFAADVEKA